MEGHCWERYGYQGDSKLPLKKSKNPHIHTVSYTHRNKILFF